MDTLSAHPENMLGKKARDKVTGFTGILTAYVVYMYGCLNYGITPPANGGKVEETHYFDDRRIEIIEEALDPEDVTGEKPGPDVRDETPKTKYGLR